MKARIEKLGLGTVQLGLNYGISNPDGPPSHKEVSRILNLAVRSGIGLLDTAALYGPSEEVIGEKLSRDHCLQMVTKTPVFPVEEHGPQEARKLRDAFERSLALLGQHRLHGLLIHQAQDLLSPGGDFLYHGMRQLQLQGLVKKIGASVYHSREIDDILRHYSIDLLQVPVSLLDQRLITSGYLEKLKALDVEIHARSVFLQGLLLMNPVELPDYFASVRRHLEVFQSECSRYGTTPLEACLDFVIGLPEIDKAIVGVCSREQLAEVLRAAGRRNPLPDYSIFAIQEESILNPSKWSI